MIKQGHRLNRFTQAHLICKHNIPVVLKGSQHPIQAINLVVFHLLAKSELWYQVFLIIILEVACRVLLTPFELKQFREHLASILLLSTLGVDLLPRLHLLIINLEQLLMRITKSCQLLPCIAIQRSVEPFKIFNLRFGLIMLADQTRVLPRAISIT